MPTGACGINCDVCGLRVLELCSSCGPGGSIEAERKMAAQIKRFGMPCLILECAINTGLEYCPRDCRQFPCELFRKGPYPFSEGFLQMQERRRKDVPVTMAPSGERVSIPDHYWDDLKEKDLKTLCQDAVVQPFPPRGVILSSLGE
ncbi:MAG: hypothetical protein V1930_07200, partial [Pseudomonadota bacterium]